MARATAPARGRGHGKGPARPTKNSSTKTARGKKRARESSGEDDASDSAVDGDAERLAARASQGDGASSGDESEDAASGGSKSVSNPGRDRRMRWHQGQYEAYRRLEERSQKKHQTKAQLEEEFKRVSNQKRWPVFTAAAFRAKKRREGDADAKPPSMSRADRSRGYALFQEEKSWKRATERFNAETGRSMSHGALIQACRRMGPELAADIVSVQVPGAKKRADWSQVEIDYLLKCTNHVGKQGEDYQGFVRHMRDIDPKWKVRSYGAFYEMFSQVRRALVEQRSGALNVGWDAAHAKELRRQVLQGLPKEQIVRDVARLSHCTRSWVRTEYARTLLTLDVSEEEDEEGDGDLAVNEDDSLRLEPPEGWEDEGDTARTLEEDVLIPPGFVGGGTQLSSVLLEAAEYAINDIARRSEGSNTDAITVMPEAVSTPAEPAVRHPGESAQDSESLYEIETVEEEANTQEQECHAEDASGEASSTAGPRVSQPDDAVSSETVKNRADAITEQAQSHQLENEMGASAELPDCTNVNSSQGAPTSRRQEAAQAIPGSPPAKTNQEEDEDEEEGEGEAVSVSVPQSDVFTPSVPWILYPTTPPQSPRRPTDNEEDEDSTFMPDAVKYANTGGYHAHISAYDDTLAGDALTLGMGPPSNEDQADQPMLEMVREEAVIGNRRWGWSVDSKMKSSSEPGSPVSEYDHFLEDRSEAVEAAETVEANRRVSLSSYSVQRPKMTVYRLNEMAMAVTAVISRRAFVSVWARHLGERHADRTTYGKCLRGACGLRYDFTQPNFKYPEDCRHWLMYARMEAYVDRIQSFEDYRLAQMCATTVLANNHVAETFRENARTFSLQIRVRSVCGPRTFFADYERACTRPYGRALLEATTVIVPGEPATNEQASLNQLRSTSFGVLRFQIGRVKFAPQALLMEYDNCSFWLVRHCDAPVRTLQGLKMVSWEAHGSLANYVRRCTAIEDCVNIPIAKIMSDRLRAPTQKTARETSRIQRLDEHKTRRGNLDAAQGRALDQAVLCEGAVKVRGSFGGGKTRLIVSMYAVLRAAYPGARVSITSETNAAIDEDLRRLAQDKTIRQEEILRIGEVSPTMEGYRQYYLSEKCHVERERAYMSGLRGRELNEHTEDFQARVLTNARLVIATVSTLGREDLRQLDAQFVINDEGAQTVEAALRQAVRPGTMTVIAIGDINQLPGYTGLVEKIRDRFSPNERRHKLGWSFMHACAHEQEARGHGFEGVTLTTQYRCHPQIGQWMQGFYEYQLQHALPSRSDYLKGFRLLQDLPVLGRNRACWLSISPSSYESPEGPRVNLAEAWTAVRLALQAAEYYKSARQYKKKLEVLVITPYHEQIRAVQRILDRTTHVHPSVLEIEVVTIDSSQGRESDVVIVSMVRRGTLGFLEDSKALSRARDYLFVLAHEPTFRESDWWASLYENAKALGINGYRQILSASDVEAILADRDVIRALCSP